MKTSMLMILFLIFSVGCFGQASAEKSDGQLVSEAVQDYVLGLYLAEPERIQRSVDTTLHKIGYYDYEGEPKYHIPMTYQQLYDLAGKWNKDGSKTNEDSPQTIEIYEVNTKTATAKLTAIWGIDYMHLSKGSDGKWRIMNIMWQSNPK